MRDAEEILQDGCEEELKELKVWLFKENIRMRELRNELEEVQSLLEKERKQFHDEMAKLTRRIEMDRKRLVQENRFFEQKMKILQSGFEKLDEDRRKFQREKDKFLICQRPANKTRGLLWEFVGGKVEPGETLQQALMFAKRVDGAQVFPIERKVSDEIVKKVDEYLFKKDEEKKDEKKA